MKETKSYLKTRWLNEFKSLQYQVTNELIHKGDLTKLELPKTADGLIDLRGYSAPKKYTTAPSNSGRIRSYVSEGIRIRNIRFINIDLSYSDFEECEFFNCVFNTSVFKEARFACTAYWGCKFSNIEFTKANFGHSTFLTGGVLFKRIIDNFMNVKFERVNFSEVNVHDQSFKNCQFIECKTGSLTLSRCVLKDIRFTGTIKNLFIKRSREVESVDLTNSLIIGINLHNQTTIGFQFPVGDTYYKFSNKSQELARLKILNNLTDEQNKVVETIKTIWTSNDLEIDFVDINWLNEDKIETGKMIIRELKKGGNNGEHS